MKRFLVFALLWTAIVTFASCGGEEMVFDPAIEQATFTEIEQVIPAVREALMDLNESITSVSQAGIAMKPWKIIPR